MRSAVFLLGLSLLAGSAVALDPMTPLHLYRRHQWTARDGLPQNSVRGLVQTTDGYIWLATQEGLVRFDGVSFSILDRSNTPVLSNDFITSVQTDAGGGMWIGTNGGGVVQLNNGRFSLMDAGGEITNAQVLSVLPVGSDEAWIGTRGRWLYHCVRGHIVHCAIPPGQDNLDVWSLYQDADGTLFIGSGQGGLLTCKDGRYRRLPLPPSARGDRILVIRGDRRGGLWLGTSAHGLWTLREGRLEPVHLPDLNSEFGVNDILLDRQGTLWIGTNECGLVRLRPQTEGEGWKLSRQPEVKVDALLEDREGNLWLGSEGSGLVVLKDSKFLVFDARSGLSYNDAGAIFQDRDGVVWIGTENSGIDRLVDGRLETVYRPGGALSGKKVLSLCQDRQGTIWAGIFGAGIRLFVDGKLRGSLTVKDGLTSDFIRCLMEDRTGVVWVGTDGGGISRIKGHTMTSLDKHSGLSRNRVTSLFQTRDGDIWAGTFGGGLNRIRSGTVTVYDRRHGFPSDIVLDIYEDDAGTLWIGTLDSGIVRFRDGRATACTRANGLFDDLVFKILEDRYHTFWLSCNRGLFKVQRRELEAFARGALKRVKCTAYNESDGMETAECNGGFQPAGWRTADDRLWFPTLKGVVVVDPDNLHFNTQPPPVVIQTVSIDHRAVHPAASVDVPPGRGEMEFGYTALSFVDPSKIRFRYRLDGYDSDWVDAGNRRTAYYTNIAPGHYTFRVIAANNDGVWNRTGASFSFYLQPHFYQTTWFYSLSGLGVVILGVGLYGFRIRRLKARERILARLVRQRTRDLEEAKEKTEIVNKKLALTNEALHKSNEIRLQLLSMAAHDLKNPLGGIMNLSDLLTHDSSDREAVRDTARMIYAGSKQLVDMVDELLATASIEGGELNLRRQPVNLSLLAETVVESNAVNARRKNQFIQFELEPGCYVEGDENRLIQALDNLVSNAIKYTPPDRQIEVRVRTLNKSIRFEVEDSGPGLTDKDREKLFERFQRLSARPTGGETSTGLGLSITRELIRMHGGRIWAEDAANGGSIFIIELPPLVETTR